MLLDEKNIEGLEEFERYMKTAKDLEKTKNLKQAEDMYLNAIEVKKYFADGYISVLKLYQNNDMTKEYNCFIEKYGDVLDYIQWKYRILAVHFLSKEKKYKKAEQYFNRADKLALLYNNPATKYNYNMLVEKIRDKGISLICMQYPLRKVKLLKENLQDINNIVFVSNEDNFKRRLIHNEYEEYFKDRFAGDFGHFTEKGNRLLAENVGKVILEKAFKK